MLCSVAMASANLSIVRVAGLAGWPRPTSMRYCTFAADPKKTGRRAACLCLCLPLSTLLNADSDLTHHQ